MAMDLIKSYQFFKPEMLKGEVCHIIGCGSVGSTVAELLARFGIEKFVLYDFDKVESRNIVNQMFFADDVGRPKVEAVRDLILKINPGIEKSIRICPDGYTGRNPLTGYVFLAVDNIDLRREIVRKNRYNTMIKGVFDFRTGLTDAQHFAARWDSDISKENLLSSMDFTHEEASATNETSACGVALSVAPTVRMICNLGVANFINFVKDDKLMDTIICDAWGFNITALEELK